MKRKFAEKGVFLYTPFCETCYNGSAETESCQVSFSLSCRAAFFPLPGQPGTNAAREWAQASAPVRFRQLRRNPISFKLISWICPDAALRGERLKTERFCRERCIWCAAPHFFWEVVRKCWFVISWREDAKDSCCFSCGNETKSPIKDGAFILWFCCMKGIVDRCDTRIPL